jgi:hypothetical protein
LTLTPTKCGPDGYDFHDETEVVDGAQRQTSQTNYQEGHKSRERERERERERKRETETERESEIETNYQ